MSFCRCGIQPESPHFTSYPSSRQILPGGWSLTAACAENLREFSTLCRNQACWLCSAAVPHSLQVYSSLLQSLILCILPESTCLATLTLSGLTRTCRRRASRSRWGAIPRWALRRPLLGWLGWRLRAALGLEWCSLGHGSTARTTSSPHLKICRHARTSFIVSTSVTGRLLSALSNSNLC
jgi:hypothetical protein